MNDDLEVGLPHRYAELTPDRLAARWMEGAPAIIPIGALEWHGPHLPLGTDGLLAEAFAARLAEATGGVLLPTLWTPITTLPHPTSLQVRTEAFRMILDDLAAGLYTAGARRIAWVTGHYAQGHEVELYEAALRAMEDHPGLTVFAATPLEPIGDDDLLDHAGRSETAQMLHVAPHLVDLTQLPETLDPKEDAVLGDHPRRATAEEGHRLFQQGLTAWTSWLESDPETLRAWYGRAFDRYQPYIDAYYEGSWEEAVQKWWSTK